ncbi:MAG: hypothetical protein AAGA48_01420 [Myxococcota bacterium]
MNALTQLLSRILDLRFAVGGAVFMGGLVFAVNASYGTGPALVAAAKQASYTFFFAGFVMRWCEHLATSVEPRSLAVATATLLPSVLAVSLTFGIHNLRGTPDPVASTLPTLFFGPPSFFVWALRRSAPQSSGQYQDSNGDDSSSMSTRASPSGSKR